jgi:GNAT superfamily N-acetyltransferase
MHFIHKLKGHRHISVINHGSTNYWHAVDLRYAVLREPLGLNYTREQLLAEDKDIHIVYYTDSIVMATLMLTPAENGHIKMRQVAVDEQYQGAGIGAKLVEYSEAYALDLGFTFMEMHARKSAVPFYLKQGYKIIGEEFMEVTIPHFKMDKDLLTAWKDR